ncbi:MAG: S8/S53 family peptidase [Bacteriovorax sp.]|nr:S8/S53 family peptidase [Bacteriovorax sp.]
MKFNVLFILLILPNILYAICEPVPTEINVEIPMINKLNLFQKHKCNQLRSMNDMPWLFSNNSETNAFFLKQNKDRKTQIDFSRITGSWAQEYIGADLVKDEISNTHLSLIPKIAILDDTFSGLPGFPLKTGEEFEHGTNTANLTFSNSIVSSGAVGKIDHLVSMNNDPAGYGKAYEVFLKDGFPNVINNSMIFWTDDRAQEPLKKIKDQNVTIIVSGGNNYPYPHLNFKNTPDKNFIIVGWIGDEGYYSQESTDGGHIDIVAPSGMNQLSSIKNGTFTRFGGSSGAAPMVSGASSNIVAVLGVSKLEIIKGILTKSSMPFPVKNNSNGSGTLNSYKAFRVAIKIKEKCLEDASCIQKEALNDSNYQFELASLNTAPSIKKILKEIPTCALRKSSIYQAKSCDLADDLKVLRKAFFLTQDKAISSLLSCTYESLGFFKNATYYDLYSKNKELTYKDLESLSPIQYFRIIGYMPNAPKNSILKKIKEFESNFNAANVDNNDIFKIIYSLKDIPNSEIYTDAILKIFTKYPIVTFGMSTSSDGIVQSEKGYDFNLDYLKYNSPLNISIMAYFLKNSLISNSSKMELKCYDKMQLNNQLSKYFEPNFDKLVSQGFCNH